MEDYKRILTAHQEYAKQIDKSMDALQHNEPQMQREKEILSEEVPHAAEQNQPEGTAKTVPKPDNAYGKRILTSFLEGNKNKKEWLSAPEQQEKSVQKKKNRRGNRKLRNRFGKEILHGCLFSEFHFF